MKRFIIALLFLAGGTGVYFYFSYNAKAAETDTPQYSFSKIERRTVQNIVSATGTLAARDVVEISTQVSGILDEIYADFNDEVEVNQLIAVIDPSILDAQVTIAQADLLRTQAQRMQAKNNYERFKPVHEKGFLSDNDFQPYEIALQTAEANVLSSEANLSRAKQNRGYAEIRSPISGIVIDRTVEPGQTVAASLSAPKLFTIAADLSDMEILAQVDESDIGQIEVGQTVRFTVAAYTDRTFEGSVEEIRLLPAVVQNVVNYTVVIAAENRRGLLLPGMTASLDFVVAEVENVLSVPSSSLTLRANDEMQAVMAERRAKMMAERGERGGSEGPGSRGGASGQRPEGNRPEGGFGGPGNGSGGQSRPKMTALWYYQDGKLAMLPVRPGVTDGAFTEVLQIRDIEIPEDLEFISRVNSTSSSSVSSSSSRNAGGPPSGLRRLGF